jgi:hypothetical protein
MPQVRSIKDEFTMFESTVAAPRHSLASFCAGGLLMVLERLHLYSAPIIISAECIQDGAAASSAHN